MEPILIGLLAVIALLLLLALGVHVAVALLAVGIVGIFLDSGFNVVATMVPHILYVSLSNYSLVLVPLFILMGHFAAASGAVEKGIHFAYTWLGALRGGLALTTIAGCGIFAAACGSSTATAAAIGKFVIPEMERYGYDRKVATGSVAASGTLGILIPPSIVLVVYGITVEESIGRLFMAGVLPGILSVIIYMVGIVLLAHFKPALVPPAVRFSWGERIKAIPGVWGILLLAAIIMGGIYGGVFTPTEAGGIGCFAAFLLLLSKRKGIWQTITTTVPEAVRTTAMVFIIMAAAILFSRFLTLAGVLDVAVNFVIGHQWPPTVSLIGILALSTIMGCFMSAMAVLLIVAPPAYSVLTTLGYNGIWIGIIMVKLFELAAITPPVGINVYVVKGIAPHVPLEDIFRGIGMFVIMDVITIAILVAFPQISLWLPGTM